jgi:hypothetical protein
MRHESYTPVTFSGEEIAEIRVMLSTWEKPPVCSRCESELTVACRCDRPPEPHAGEWLRQIRQNVALTRCSGHRCRISQASSEGVWHETHNNTHNTGLHPDTRIMIMPHRADSA